MLYFLDTDVVSNLRKRAPSPQLLAWLGNMPADEICIPLMVIFEIQLGIASLRLDSKQEKADEIQEWLERLLNSRFGDTLLSPDLASVRLQARMFADPKLRNFLVPDPKSPKLKFGADLVIASMAIAHQATIVSFDDDYLGVHTLYPLPGLFNPGRGEWRVRPPEKTEGTPG